MRILIVNIGLVGRSGTEVVTIETACGLRARGADVRIYAPQIGPSGEALRALGVPVESELHFNNWTPDLIQANQTTTLLPVIRRFPSVPVVAICHDANVWYSEPIQLPQITTYLAVNTACRDRVLSRTNLLPHQVAILPNAVDLKRFERRAPLPPAPRRALALTKQSNHVPHITEACAQEGIELELLGSGVGAEVDDLAGRLRDFDLVFATARMALEAMATGCAVIVCDARGLAGLVTKDAVQAWRTDNFGFRLLDKEVSAEALRREIGRYDAADAAAVSDTIREHASLERYLDQLERVHREAQSDVPAMSSELMLLMEGCTRLVQGAERYITRTSVDWKALHEEYAEWNDQLQRSVSEYQQQIEENTEWNDQLQRSVSEYQQQIEENTEWNDQLQRAVSQYKQDLAEHKDYIRKLETENAQFATEIESFRQGTAIRDARSSLSRLLSRLRAGFR